MQQPSFRPGFKKNVVGRISPILESSTTGYQYIDRHTKGSQRVSQSNHLGSLEFDLWFDNEKIQVTIGCGISTRVGPKQDHLRACRGGLEQ
jgi:hypothetical protein